MTRLVNETRLLLVPCVNSDIYGKLPSVNMLHACSTIITYRTRGSNKAPTPAMKKKVVPDRILCWRVKGKTSGQATLATIRATASTDATMENRTPANLT